MARSLMTRPTCELSCWTSVPSAVTVTVSSTVEGSSLRLTVAVCVTLTSTSSTTTRLNPCAAISTLYRPGWSSGTAKEPSSPVVTWRCAEVARLVTVTDAPGTTAPAASSTRPVS